jgi:MFS family permease
MTLDETTQTSVIKHRPFLLFYISRVFTTFSYQMTMVALAWQLYSLTDSAFDLGLIGLAQFIPMVALTIPVGHIADRYNRRTILMCCQIVTACAAVVLLAGTLGGWLDRTLIYVIVVAMGSARAFEMPTMGAIVPNLVPASLVPRAMAWTMSANQSAQIVGPALGGFLYAFGPNFVYGLAVVLWCIGATCASMMRFERVVHPQQPMTISSLLAGFSFVLKDRIILGTASLDLFAILFGGATALMPIFARDILQTGPWGLGLLRSAPAVGAVTMSLVLARYPLKPPVGPILFKVILLFGAATCVFALSTNLFLSLAALAVMGGSDVVSVVIRFSLVQLRTPDVMRGRVSAVNSLFVGTSNQLGDFESGIMASLVGAMPAVLIGGIGTIAVVVTWMMWLFPEMRRIRTLEGDDVELQAVAPVAVPEPVERRTPA